ncbi:MAG: hypothetical protein ABFS41_03080 [Myxococcota bacterium]
MSERRRRLDSPGAWLATGLVGLGAVFLGMACASLPPRQIDDVCAIFSEKDGWQAAAVSAERRWGVAVPVMMAVLHQESRFRARARPDWRFGLGVVPLGPASSAFGYGQAKVGTWGDYQRLAKRPDARRDRFADAVDFVGWYGDVIERAAGVRKDDPFNLYLAYHEGPAGFSRRSFEAKPWLLGVARKVEERADSYRGQHERCRPPAGADAPAP